MEVTSTLLKKSQMFADDSSDGFPTTKKFFVSSIGIIYFHFVLKIIGIKLIHNNLLICYKFI